MRAVLCLPLILHIAACNGGPGPKPDAGAAADMGQTSTDGGLPAPIDSPWTFEHPLPQGNALHAVARGMNDVYAVGEQGTVVRTDGKTARQEARGLTTATLRAVLLSGTGVWAAGDGGFVLRQSSGRWTLSRAGSQALYALWQKGGQIFAAGVGNQLYSGSGDSWRGQPLASQRPEDAIRAAVIAGSDVYLFGTRGRILHQIGSTWFLEGDGVTQAELFAAAVDPEGAIYAVGAGGRILRRDPKTTRWASEHPLPDRMPLTQTELRAVWTVDKLVFAVAGDGTVLRRGDMGWERVAPVGARARIRAATGWDQGAYAVGDAGTLMFREKDGMPWQPAAGAVQVTTGAITGIASAAMDTAYAVTDEGYVLRRTGMATSATWSVDFTPTPRPGQPLSAVAWVGQEAYAVGMNGLILRRGQQAWEAESYTFNGRRPDLRGVWIRPGTQEVYAVGSTYSMRSDEESVILRKAGGMWTQEVIKMEGEPIQATLFSVGGGASEVFAVGSQGTILRREADGWKTEARELARDVQLFAIYPARMGYYAVGTRGTVLRRDQAGMWTRGAIPGVNGPLNAITVTTGDLIWVAGAEGLVARQQGEAWTVEPTLYPGSLQGLLSTGQMLLAVGTGGAVLRRSLSSR